MKSHYTLSIDTLGSETRIEDICYGLNLSYERNLNYKYLIFGNASKIKHSLSKFKSLRNVTQIINCEQFVSMDDIPSEVIKEKQNSSMSMAVSSVSNKDSDAVLLAAIGDPKFDKLPRDKRPETGLLHLRSSSEYRLHLFLA